MPRSHLLVSWHFHLAGLCLAPIIHTEHSLFLKQTCKWRWQEQLLSRWRAGHFHCFDNFSVPAVLFYCKYVLFLRFFLLPKVNMNHLVRCCVYVYVLSRLLCWFSQTFSGICLISFGFSNRFLSLQTHRHKQTINRLEKHNCLHTLLASASFGEY